RTTVTLPTCSAPPPETSPGSPAAIGAPPRGAPPSLFCRPVDVVTATTCGAALGAPPSPLAPIGDCGDSATIGPATASCGAPPACAQAAGQSGRNSVPPGGHRRRDGCRFPARCAPAQDRVAERLPGQGRRAGARRNWLARGPRSSWH